MVPLAYPLAQSVLNLLRLGLIPETGLQTRTGAPTVAYFDMILGTEWVIDAVGCDPAALTDLHRLRSLFDRVISDLDLHVLREIAWHQFAPPGGVSGLALLSESHLACHTYPEFGAATFNLYCCRSRTAWPWEQMLMEMLGATSVSVRVFERLIPENEPAIEELVNR